MLPGRGDDVANIKASGIADAIQSSLPDAEVVLTGISLAYYMEGRMPQRLHEEIILPAHERGYTEIWLVGASMGATRALMYDSQYPRRCRRLGAVGFLFLKDARCCRKLM